MGPVKQDKALDSTLGAIVSHPLRTHCLVILSERVASPNEIANELGEEVSHVAYHVKVLRECGCIELVDTAARRGATEHYYRGIQRPHLSDEEFAALSLEERQDFVRLIIQFGLADAARSLNTYSFGKRPDHHISRLPGTVDEQGWEELRDIAANALDRSIEAIAASGERMAAEGGGAGFPVRVFSMLFEMPDPSA